MTEMQVNICHMEWETGRNFRNGMGFGHGSFKIDIDFKGAALGAQRPALEGRLQQLKRWEHQIKNHH